MNEAVSVKNVSKTFSGKTAVDQISFTIQKGEAAAILGPNGAGKSTTIHMLLGLLHTSSGEIHLFGQQPDKKEVREKMGIMLQEVSVMPGLKVKELLELVRRYYPNPISMSDLINLTGLTAKDLNTRSEKLSGGQKRRLSFAMALAGNPELIILDEPTTGMDINARNRFWETIGILSGQGKTVVFTTHYLQEADDFADRIILFRKGRIIEDGSPSYIKSKLAKKSVSFQIEPEISLQTLMRHGIVKSISRKGDRVFVHTDDTDGVLHLLFNEKLKVWDIQIEGGKLEEAFEKLTEGV